MTTDRSAAAPQPQPLLKRVVNALKVAVVPPVGYQIIQMLRRTMTWRTEGSEHVNRLFAEEKRVILAFWHAQQLMMPLAIPGLEAHVLISQHRDGELIRRIVARFGLDAVRGSSTRGGAEAFRQLIRLGRSGGNLVLTPDGPKGPRQVAKVGVVQLARATGLPIIPMAFGCSKKNSSRAGTGSSCPIRSRGASFSWGRRSACRPTPRPTTLSVSAGSWKRR
ncbi:MAG TPA: lysophospholipid acyltransferase family protein [Nitrospira sp.]|nr:lysophospholipid acyltransferase family protein [Nitrospira sp.]HQW88621.1 lysophospholipid acyltransferase family protein [Nitrospira sp.]